METLIEASDVSKHFAGRTVLENVAFAIQPGEILSLVGLNGCGKTTLLRILLGLEKADSGSVTRRKNLRIGYLPQRFRLDDTIPLSVESFLKISAADGTLYETVLDELEIRHLLARQVTALSGGEMQRVMLARAMMRKPDLLVLDEPVQGVDISGQAELYQLIAHLNQTHDCAVLMVSHDLHLVMSATDRVLCLSRHICCSGHPHKVSKDPAFIKLFGDSAAKSLALYEHHHDHSHDLRGRVVEDNEHECDGGGHG